MPKRQKQTCTKCNGSKELFTQCSSCHGTGSTYGYICTACEGKKEFIDPCVNCDGTGQENMNPTQ